MLSFNPLENQGARKGNRLAVKSLDGKFVRRPLSRVKASPVRS
jgi:hypothetical protein